MFSQYNFFSSRSSKGLRANAMLVLSSVFLADGVVARQPLFDSLDLLEPRIEAPFRRLISEQEDRFPAHTIFAITPEDTIHLEISPRGKSRLVSGICDFPGLMLFFSGGTEGGAFEGQEALPVVTHCKDRDSHEQLMFLEYLDWSYAFAPPDEQFCCHNSVPIGDMAGPVFPIPFDFDQAGLVNAPYATVDPSLPIRRVRDRLFRGICGPLGPLNIASGLFELKRMEI